MELDTDGLPRCDIMNNLLLSSLQSSIMFSAEWPNITDFCDGSEKFPHSPLNPTRHNYLCDGKPVWEIIKNSEDFILGKNSPLGENFSEPQVLFKCQYEEENQSIFIAVQNSSMGDITRLITEMRYTLLRFLIYDIPSSMNPSIFTFSDEQHTNDTSAVKIDLEEPRLVESLLRVNIRMANNVEDVCLICAINKVKNILTEQNKHDVIVVFIVFASTFKTTNVADFKTALTNERRRFNFIILQDSPDDVMLGDILNAVQDNGGELFLIPVNLVLLNVKLSMALVALLRNVKKQKVFVAHQTTFLDIDKDISDTFVVDGNLEGQLLYTLKCNDNELLYIDDTNCTSLSYLPSSAYICGNKMSLQPTSDAKTWTFNFRYLKGISSLMCSSLVTVKTSLKHQDTVTLKGWLNRHKVTPGKEALIIYAEVLKDFVPVPNLEVEAYVYDANNGFVMVELRDNGNGDPDVKKGDGIYSRYFAKFGKKGIYSVMILTKELINCEFSGKNETLCSKVSRMEFIGSFNLLEDAPINDIYPPNRIVDLEVVAVDHENRTVTLQWTAPGNDYDDGQATLYEVSYYQLWPSDQTKLNQTQFLEPISHEKLKPLPSGTREIVTFFIPDEEIKAVYTIHMMSIDGSTNKANSSNKVQVYMQGALNLTTGTFTAEYITSTTVSVTDISEEKETTSFTENDIYNITIDPGIVGEVTTNTSNLDQKCADREFIIILASSISGGILLFIIIINLLLWICCCKKKYGGEKRMSKHALMRPPHNIDIQLQSSSHTSDSTENLGDSQESSCIPLKTHGEQTEYQLSNVERDKYFRNSAVHSDRAGRNDTYQDYREGFQHVMATPAYASIDLNHEYLDNEHITNNEHVLPFHKQIQEDKVQMYPLGEV